MWLFYYFLLYFNLIFYEGINSLLKYALISVLSIYLLFIIILVYDSYSTPLIPLSIVIIILTY